ncbi:MAG: hypothetical protein GY894_00330 [Planctomycetes bacterium]|nr:hypothetical protein [Planctomycetota bacterium]
MKTLLICMSSWAKCFKGNCKVIGFRWAFLASGVIAGCVTVTPPPCQPALPDDATASLLNQWSERCSDLDRLRFKGQIQLEWEDDQDGRQTSHKEQGDMELLLDGASRGSLRITKFGDVKYWLGMTPKRYWEFDLMSDPTRLRVRQPSVNDGGLLASPELLRMLLSLDPWPEGAKVQQRGSNLHISGTAFDGTFEATVRRSDLRVERVEVDLGDRGQFIGVHRWTTGATTIDNTASARQLAKTIDLHVPDSMIKLQVVTATALSAEALKPLADVWFDLDRIQTHLRPDVVE